MRKLAQELGVKAMSLYNHITNKDDLLDAMVDAVVSEIEVPDLTLDWKTALRRRAMTAHAVLLRHPWVTAPLVSRVNIGPAMRCYVNATMGCLIQAGFSYGLADKVIMMLDSHLYGFTLQELNFPFAPEEYAQAAKDYLPMLSAEEYPYFYGLAHMVAEGEYDGLHDFEFGLDLLLESVERRRQKSSDLG